MKLKLKVSTECGESRGGEDCVVTLLASFPTSQELASQEQDLAAELLKVEQHVDSFLDEERKRGLTLWNEVYEGEPAQEDEDGDDVAEQLLADLDRYQCFVFLDVFQTTKTDTYECNVRKDVATLRQDLVKALSQQGRWKLVRRTGEATPNWRYKRELYRDGNAE